MSLIIKNKTLDKYLVTDLLNNSDEIMSYNYLKKILISYGFDIFKATDILNLSRINPAIYVDDKTVTYKLITNSDKKMSVDEVFNQIFNQMGETGDIESFSDKTNSFRVKGFKYNELSIGGSSIFQNNKK